MGMTCGGNARNPMSKCYVLYAGAPPKSADFIVAQQITNVPLYHFFFSFRPVVLIVVVSADVGRGTAI